jgi:caffeoyl-CoA O-methyltransferase
MEPERKFITLDPSLYDYVVEHGNNSDQILRELASETAKKLGSVSGMQISPEQGTFMTMLARSIGAKSAIEVGTFTGYSAICIARACHPTDSCYAATSAKNGRRLHGGTGTRRV